MNISRPSYILLGLMAMTLVACHDDDLYIDSSSDGICFGVTLNDNARNRGRSDNGVMPVSEVLTLTDKTTGDSLFIHSSVSDYGDSDPARGSRSTIVSSDNAMYGSFSVSAYYYTDSWNDDKAESAPNYFTDNNAVMSGSIYRLIPQRYWPSNGKVRFIAYAPAGDDSFIFDDDDSGKGPAVHISIAPDVASQKDLLVSYGAELDCKGRQSAAPLNFKHALTAVRFTADKTMLRCVIKSITIKNVYYQGDFLYNLPAAALSSSSDVTLDDNFTHSNLLDRSFTVDLDYELKGSTEEQLTLGETTLLMLPQTLPADATIEIEIQKVDSDGNPIDGSFDTITGNIGGRSWPAGKIVTYKLSNTDQILEVSEGTTFNYLGKTYDSANDVFNTGYDVTVESHNSAGNIRWKISYMDEGSDTWSPTSSWLSVDPSWTWSDAKTQTVPFRAASTYQSINIDNNLKNAASKGSSASPYNLSNPTGQATVENTANCYMVDAPGYYILPLVYGNAYENGQANTSAYQYTASSGSNILPTFRNHLDNPISAPYIVDNAGCTPNSAALVWQDEKNLVSDISYVPSAFNNKGGIRFRVDPSNIKQGNAVIALKGLKDGESTVIWSWHIWVTRFDFDKTIGLVNQDGRHIDIMPVNLGWCSNGEIVRLYPRRSCKVKFTPAEGDEALSQTIEFVQESHLSFPVGNNPYYQWGRKDPFWGSNIPWGNKPRWDGDGKEYSSAGTNNPERLFSSIVEAQKRLTTREALGMMIQNPDKWHNPPAVATTLPDGTESYKTQNEIYDNLWGDLAFDAKKTVYDPCPAGYHVNYYYTYTGFLDKDYNWSSPDPNKTAYVREIAPDWNGDRLVEFYTDPSKMKSVIFPICGYRDWNNNAEVTNFTTEAFIWERGCYQGADTYLMKCQPFNNKQVAPVSSFFATDGMPIRPELQQ